jgi:hypothetical protein
VGFEILYWVPLVRWAVEEFPELRDRLIITSRGGARSWYEGLAADGRYVDVLDVFSVDEFVSRRERMKQRGGLSDLELDFYARVRERMGIETAANLHPELLWHMYYRMIKVDERAYARAVSTERDEGGAASGLNAHYAPLTPPPAGKVADALPDGEFVAVRFYFRPSFPDTPENRALASGLVEQLAERTHVVLLNNRLELDEHSDLDVHHPNVVSLHELMTPGDNLHVQSIAMSRAAAFVGTYGGLAYVPPHFGVPSLCFLEDPTEPRAWHLELAQAMFQHPRWGSLAVLSTADTHVLDLLAGRTGDSSGARPA